MRCWTTAKISKETMEQKNHHKSWRWANIAFHHEIDVNTTFFFTKLYLEDGCWILGEKPV